MSTSVYKVVLADVLTGSIRGELPVDSIAAVTGLNAPGSLNVSMPLRLTRPGVPTSFTPADFDPGRSALYVVRDGVCLWSGILWTWDASVRDNSITLNAEGWQSYWRHRFLKSDVDYAAVDQAEIVADLIDWAQLQPGGNIGIDTSTATPTGRVRDRTWWSWERHNIGELIENLSAVIDGFHFAYPSTFDGSTFTTSLRIGYPATGRTTNIVLEMGGNVELLGLSSNGTSMVNHAEMIGSGQTADVPIRAGVDTSLLDTTPLLESCTSVSDVTDPTTLQEKADRALSLGRQPVQIPRLRIGADADPKIGTYDVGDRLRVRGSYGLMDLDDDYVLTEIALRVAPDAESVDLTVAPVLAYS